MFGRLRQSSFMIHPSLCTVVHCTGLRSRLSRGSARHHRGRLSPARNDSPPVSPAGPQFVILSIGPIVTKAPGLVPRPPRHRLSRYDGRLVRDDINDIHQHNSVIRAKTKAYRTCTVHDGYRRRPSGPDCGRSRPAETYTMICRKKKGTYELVTQSTRRIRHRR